MFLKNTITALFLLLFTNLYALDMAVTLDNLPSDTATANQILTTFKKHNLAVTYHAAPVTVDFFAQKWSEPYNRCLQKQDEQSIQWLKQNYFGQAMNAVMVAHYLSQALFQRDIKNILLIHGNAMNASMLDDILTAYENFGVRFISLPEALQDEVYKNHPKILKQHSYSFLNQVRLARGLANPPQVKKLYAALPEKELDKICR